MIRKLFSHSLIYGLASQISTVAGIFALPIITKDLTEKDFGVWGVTMAYMGAFNALAALGTGVVLSNSFFKSPSHHRWLWKQIYGFIYLWTIPFTIVCATLLWFLIPQEATENRVWLLVGLLLPGLLFGPTTLIGTYFYQLSQNPIPIAIRSTIFGMLTIALNIYFISWLKLGYMGWLWAQMIVVTGMGLSYWVPLNFMLGYSPIFNFKWRRIRKTMRIALPTIPHTYSVFLLSTSDRIVLDRLNTSIGDLGQYDVASKFGSYFNAISVAANKAVSPMMLSCYKQKKDADARSLVFVIQICMLAGTAMFCLWAREIFQVLIKNGTLAKVYPLSIIIVMAYNYRPMYVGAMNKLFYTENTNLLWKVSFIGGVGNIVLNLIFVPLFGFEAAAYTTFVCLMYMGFSGHFLKQVQEIHDVNYYPLVWLATIVGLTAAVYVLRDVDVAFKLILSVVGCGIILSIAAKYRHLFTIGKATSAKI